MRSRLRRNHWPRIRTAGGWSGYGPQEADQITGRMYPIALMTPQRGGMVSGRPQDRNVDRVEGREWSAESSLPPPLPLYRLKVVSGAAFATLVTIDPNERDSTVALGYLWKPAGYGYADVASAESDAVPVYRLFNGSDHLFTTNAAERAALIALDWINEGTGFYAFTAAAHNRTPLWRAVSAGGLHYFTIDRAEYEALPPSYTREGVAAYVLTGAERTVI